MQSPDKKSSSTPNSEAEPVSSSPNVERAIRGLNEAARKHRHQEENAEPVYSSPNAERAARGLKEAARKHQQQKQ